MATAAAAKQDIFIWEGRDKKGQKVKGEVGGQNVSLVKASLRRQGINPTKVRKKAKPLLGGKRRIAAKDIAIFARQIATMMSSGVPLVQAFDIIGELLKEDTRILTDPAPQIAVSEMADSRTSPLMASP